MKKKIKQYTSKTLYKPPNHRPKNEHRNEAQSDVRFASALEHQREASLVGEMPI
jgi:hypothetical protein